jgi:hypothetical protein
MCLLTPLMVDEKKKLTKERESEGERERRKKTNNKLLFLHLEEEASNSIKSLDNSVDKNRISLVLPMRPKHK